MFAVRYKAELGSISEFQAINKRMWTNKLHVLLKYLRAHLL